MLSFAVDKAKCVKCGLCVQDCPTRIIEIPERELPRIKDGADENCLGCQHCYTLCPTGALSIFGLNSELDSIELNAQSLPAADKLEVLIRGRRSTRKYKQENVEPGLIQKLLKATVNCPTAVNNSALRFDVIADIGKMDDIRNGIMDSLITYSQEREFPPEAAYLAGNAIEPWKKYKADVIFRTAPHALIVSAPAAIPYCSMIDVSIALSYFELLANASGVGTTWCGLMKQALELLPEYKEKLITPGAGVYYCMLFGYPDVRYARTAKREAGAKINYI